MDSLILNSQLAFDLSISSPHSHSPCLHILRKFFKGNFKQNSSLLISSANTCLGLSHWVRLSLLGSLLFCLEPKEAEECTAMTIYNISVVLWHRNGEIQAREPLFPFLCNLHGSYCWLIVIQAEFVPINLCRSWGERQIVPCTAGKPKEPFQSAHS